VKKWRQDPNESMLEPGKILHSTANKKSRGSFLYVIARKAQLPTNRKSRLQDGITRLQDGMKEGSIIVTHLRLDDTTLGWTPLRRGNNR
jgi:hypothetical protein